MKCKHDLSKLGLEYNKEYNRYMCWKCKNFFIEIPYKTYIRLMELIDYHERSYEKTGKNTEHFRRVRKALVKESKL